MLFTWKIIMKIWTENGLTNEYSNRKIGNLFDLVLAASNRTRALNAGHRSKLNVANSNPVKSLVEIEQGHVGREYLYKTNQESK